MAELRVKSTGTLKLFESDNTSSVTIASPASLGADRTITLPDASVTLASGTMLATDGSGASLTALNASELGSGTVPTARLGSGTASSSTILYGDQTYKAEPTGGKILQVVSNNASLADSTTSSSFVTYNHIAPTITCSATSSKVWIVASVAKRNPDNEMFLDFYRSISGGASTSNLTGETIGACYWSSTSYAMGASYYYMDSPSTTSEITYKMTFRNANNSTTIVLGSDDGYSSVTLFEIGA